jgi:hypothetical protein
MKKIIIIMLMTVSMIATTHKASAQTQDLQQLILDIEKLTQFKAILSDMKTGYTLLTQGYNQVKDLSQGSFNLHSAFLNSLMAVSPEVRKYGRIADIIANQASIVAEYKATLKQARASGDFSAQEIIYMNQVFSDLLTHSVNNLTNLANVITAGTLRMSDAERLQAIDHIYADTQNKLVFLRDFDNQVAIMAVQRQKEQNDVQTLQKLY